MGAEVERSIHVQVLDEIKRVHGEVPADVEEELFQGACGLIDSDEEALHKALNELRKLPNHGTQTHGPVRHKKEQKQQNGMRWHPNNEGIKRRLKTDKRHKIAKG